MIPLLNDCIIQIDVERMDVLVPFYSWLHVAATRREFVTLLRLPERRSKGSCTLTTHHHHGATNAQDSPDRGAGGFYSARIEWPQMQFGIGG